MNRRVQHVRLVLVEPAGPLNVGAIARIMKNMGLCDWVLVNPQCDWLSPEALQMAVHADDLLQKICVVDRLEQALENCQRVVATTGRGHRALATDLEPPRQVLPWLMAAPTAALIFGPENRGLNNDELKYAQRYLQIPSSDAYPSLNLAQAVAICCYELTQVAPVVIDAATAPIEPLANFEVLEGYYQHLEMLLLKIGYLYPHTVVRRMEKLRRLFNRATLTEQEVAMLRGILHQMEWVWQQSALSKQGRES